MNDDAVPPDMLDERRRVAIRSELLDGLAPRAPRAARPRWLSWLFVLVPAASAAGAYLLWVNTQRAVVADGAVLASSRAEEARGEAQATAPAAPAAPASKKAAVAPGSPLAASQRGAASAEPGGAPAAQFLDDMRGTVIQDLARNGRELRRQLLARTSIPGLARAHAALDAAHAPAELEDARGLLTDLSRELGPGGVDPDGRLIRQDLYCRLAETALRLGEPQTALEWTRRGLALDGPPTPFLAQLQALEGDAFEALGDQDRAVRSYVKALAVHERLLDENLDGR